MVRPERFELSTYGFEARCSTPPKLPANNTPKYLASKKKQKAINSQNRPLKTGALSKKCPKNCWVTGIKDNP